MYLTFKIKYMGGIIWANVDKVLLIKSGFLPNKLNKYSIRKFTVGTASILLGSTLILEVVAMKRKLQKKNKLIQLHKLIKMIVVKDHLKTQINLL